MAVAMTRMTIKATISKPREIRHAETGSPFTMTRMRASDTRRPGDFEPETASAAASSAAADAFAPGRSTGKPDPKSFLRAHRGWGGKPVTAMAEAKKAAPASAGARGPPKAGATKPRYNPPNTRIRMMYERGDLPCLIDQGGVHNKLAWTVQIEDLEFSHYLPAFFDGLREEENPYRFLAMEGVTDLLENGPPDKILACIPLLILPIKNALATRRHMVMCLTLRMLQRLVVADADMEGGGLIGRALVPYYRQLLPVMAIFVNKSKNIGDAIDYSQRKGEDLGELIQETLHLLEMHGGEEALINIQYLVPTYQSCMV